MKKKVLMLLMVLSVAVLVMPGQTGRVFAAIPIITAEELQPGMRGIAKTVIQGATIETFDVEVLGVTGSGSEGRNILVKASGDVIDRAGGIAQGMSGSPVYIDGRLAGAVAYGRSFSDPAYCFLTPIEDMLKMFEPTEPRPSVFLPKNTPLMAAGFSEAGLAYLQEKLSPLSLQAVAAPAGSSGLNDVVLEPGSSVGVELIRGDVSLGAIGTVTWTDEEGRILAFGHPFLQRGAVDYFMTNAWIFASIPNMESAYKIGVLGKTMGNVKQDRYSGVGGQLGGLPKIIPVFVAVTDVDRGINKSAAVQLVTDELLVSPLVDAVTYNTVSKAIDRTGGGTARVSFRITARGDKSGEIVVSRENMFYAPANLAQTLNAELLYATEMLMKNKFEKVTIFDVNVNVEAGSSVDVAEISKARLLTREVKPGEKALIEIEFQPYRGEPFKRTFTFKVPEGTKPGPLPIMVRGGASSTWLISVLQKQNPEGIAPEQTEKATLTEFLDDFNQYDYNNSVIIDIIPQALFNAEKVKVETGKMETDEDNDKIPMTVRALFKGTTAKQRHMTDFIVDRELEMNINVVP